MTWSESSREVVLKLKTTQTAKRALRSLAAAEATRSPAASAERGPLARLLEGSLVKSMEPLFPTRATRRAAALERMVMSLDEDADDDLAGLNVMHFDSADDANTACQMLAGDATVEYAHHPQERYLAAKAKRRAPRRRRVAGAADPLLNRQWGLRAVELFQAQSAAGFKEATDIIIAVVDTGVDSDHPDLKGIVSEEQNFTSGPTKDTQGHGTHVIGIIGAVVNNGVGVSGVCQSLKIMSLKALGPYNAAGYYRAIRHATDNGAQVVNLSLGGDHDPTEELLICRAIDRKVAVVAAMGNDGPSAPPSFPAAIEGVISVGASTEVDGLANFSQIGAHIDLVAPGVNILSTVPTYPVALAEATDYEAWPGTSMATPFVAATVALLLAKRPSASLTQIVGALHQGADKVLEQAGFNNRFGHGRLNVRRSLEKI
jgi:hypothetical protein